MIVVMAVIVLLATILLPMLLKVYGRGKKTRASADLQAIAVGLDAYRADFGDYPRFPMGPVAAGTNDASEDRGARLLCRALLAPGPAAAGVGTTAFDGADGPGFRLRTTGLGKVYGPYLNPEKFKCTTPINEASKLLDSEGKVILYYPAKPGNPDVAAAYVMRKDPTAAIAPPIPLYNAWDNDATGLLPLAMMQTIMGDKLPANTPDGMIGAGETAAFTGPYILWTPGADGMYGLDSKNPRTTDDVVNFDIPSDLVRP
jgi:type II secretory pathway pseudopilin PulG